MTINEVLKSIKLFANWRAENNPNYSPFDPTMDSEIYSCTHCHTKQNKISNYCPNCGARMEKVLRKEEYDG